MFYINFIMIEKGLISSFSVLLCMLYKEYVNADRSTLWKIVELVKILYLNV